MTTINQMQLSTYSDDIDDSEYNVEDNEDNEIIKIEDIDDDDDIYLKDEINLDNEDSESILDLTRIHRSKKYFYKSERVYAEFDKNYIERYKFSNDKYMRMHYRDKYSNYGKLLFCGYCSDYGLIEFDNINDYKKCNSLVFTCNKCFVYTNRLTKPNYICHIDNCNNYALKICYEPDLVYKCKEVRICPNHLIDQFDYCHHGSICSCDQYKKNNKKCKHVTFQCSILTNNYILFNGRDINGNEKIIKCNNNNKIFICKYHNKYKCKCKWCIENVI